MIGALMCPTCNRIKPKIEEYCRDNNVVFNYYILGINTPRDILSIITAYHVKKFPTFIIYKDNEDIVINGLCFIKVSKSAKINIYVLEGVNVYLRDSLI